MPAAFRFSLKVPKEITHVKRLTDCESELARFLEQTASLGEKRAVLLAQLPPSLAFEPHVAQAFFEMFRRSYAEKLVCEPRHATWFTAPALKLFEDLDVGRCGADPAPVPGANAPAGPGVRYLRWHGSPRTYYSSYDEAALRAFAKIVQDKATETWCIFDNTAAGAAAANALDFQAILQIGEGQNSAKI